MANIDQLLQRNKDFAATGAHETASIIARHPVYLITCLDPRTDPSAFLELELGDAMVVRNASAHYDGAFTRPGEVLAGREAVPPPGPSRAEVLRSLA